MNEKESIISSVNLDLGGGDCCISVIRTTQGLADDSPVDIIRCEVSGNQAQSSTRIEILGEVINKKALLEISAMFAEAAKILHG